MSTCEPAPTPGPAFVHPIRIRETVRTIRKPIPAPKPTIAPATVSPEKKVSEIEMDEISYALSIFTHIRSHCMCPLCVMCAWWCCAHVLHNLHSNSHRIITTFATHICTRGNYN